ncbi:MAG: efflux transporter outer membrane subunit, partial [Verrucomicrobiales bacterium]
MRPLLLRRLAPLLLLASCTVGPDYEGPQAEVEAAFKNAGFTAPAPDGSWWTLFGDAKLTKLIGDVQSSNPSALAALERYEQVKAEIGIIRSEGAPLLTGEAFANRQGDSRNSNFSAGTYSNYRAALDLSWEIDLWGRVRRRVNRAVAESEASDYDADAVILALSGEAARAYFSLRSADLEIELLEETGKLRAQARRLMKARFEAGRSSSLDYNRAVTEHESVESELQQLRAQRGKFENALATLTGQNASGYRLRPNGRRSKIPAVPTAVPSDLLRRRPDIAAAERRLAAASESRGIVIASYLPRFSITGFAGAQSLRSSDLFDPSSTIWRLGPEVSFPVYQG